MSTLPVDPSRTIDEMADCAAELHNLMQLDTGSRPYTNPCPQVMEFAQWAYRTMRPRPTVSYYVHDST